MKAVAVAMFTAVFLFSGCGTQQLKADLAAANAQATQLEADLAAARAANEGIEDANALAELRLERYRDLAAQLRAAYGDEGLSIKIRGGRMVVQLPNSILFDSGQIAIKEDGQATLGKFATVMKDVPKRRFLIAGHTDSVPVKAGARFKDNWELSALRAVAACNHLVSAGVAATQMGCAGFADHLPDASNDTEEGKAMNRRLEIIVMPMGDEIPKMPKNLKK